MTQSSIRLQLRSKTPVEAFVFQRLKKGSDNVSAKGTRAIAICYLAELVAQVDPDLNHPALRVAVLDAIHELEARLNLAKSLFPGLTPVAPPNHPMGRSNLQPGHAQAEPRFEMVAEPAKPEQRQGRQDNASNHGHSERALRSDGEMDPFDMAWSEFEVGEKENR